MSTPSFSLELNNAFQTPSSMRRGRVKGCWSQIPALPVRYRVSLGKLLTLSEPQFLICEME